MDELGIGGDRIEMYFMTAAEADKFVSAVNEMTEKLQKLGPNPLKAQ
ncbi:Coenzyme F420-reducing hydrogenase, delta subunit [Methanocaldococcus bathoardescens]|uniref:Coenzyme F420-reducing hydrogenase, delta subunit n=1 Tax=Methanocaldococcus bathoardescens TaxID=1301915 RepID=A0A076LF87_9EURY|nr:Coenzyme F420-reducing hydrogenase, delta subunit [Methanocaldococcus bathoardescens]